MSALKSQISALIDAAEPEQVWVPTDFAQLGSRDAIDKTLQRMVQAGKLRRIDRGLYDRPTVNSLTKRPTTPDYRSVVQAIARLGRITTGRAGTCHHPYRRPSPRNSARQAHN